VRDIIGAGAEIIGDDMADMIGADEEVLHDLVGDEIVGDEIVGQPVIGGRRAPRGRKQVLHPDSFMWRREFIGLTAAAATIAGGQSTVIVQPQRKFKTKRVVVISTIAAFFAFVDLKVGQNSQAAAVGNTPCQAFVENAVSCYVDFDTADIGNLITMIVVNNDAVPHLFTAALFGIALRPQYG
jgi:hypothetical protein